MQSDGKGETRQLTKDGDSFRYSPNWAPDSKKLTFTDKAGNLFLHDIDAGNTKKIDVEPFGSPLVPSWSHDGQWLAYSKSAPDRTGSTTGRAP